MKFAISHIIEFKHWRNDIFVIDLIFYWIRLMILKIYIDEANGDLAQFKLLLEKWYDATMNRVSGWYKRQANRILIIIGLCMAVAFNVSTIDIVRTLSVDKNVREAMVKSASDYINHHIDPVHQKTASMGKTKTDSSARQNNNAMNTDTSTAQIRLALDSIKYLYAANIEEANTTLGLGWGDFGFTEDSIKWVKSIQNTGTPQDKSGEPVHKGFFAKIIYVLKQTAKTPHYWLGFLITAFAISLGAPFWFDLLNRFVNLRVTGAKPAPAAKTDGKNK